MGVDFLQKIGNTIAIARDRELAALAHGDLFARCIERAAQYELLKLEPGQSLAQGDEVNIEVHADEVVAVVGDRIVGKIENPCKALSAMLDQYGIVGGRVDEIHQSARVADIEIIE
ncbi:hypothetical protein [Hyphomicrobium zavarzinii]|jgi:hypothetical protein|uniref:hypothetical protein n=1 Tax=Hyphomicrobium zavarzinii TaxID=48292 RepID=UPI0003633DBF|nr:hypothetical protein [Hyphomicrobium zavarzinii]